MPSERFRFTNPRIEKFTCPEGRRERVAWDVEVKGLGIRSQYGGARRFIFRAKMRGKSIRVTIGPPEAWSIRQAREEAQRLRTLINQGIDPHLEKRRRQDESAIERAEMERKRVTLADVWDEYVSAREHDWSGSHREAHDKAMRRPGQKRKRSNKLTVAGPLWALREDRLVELTAQRLIAWLVAEKRKKRLTTTAQCYRLLRACLEWVAEQPQYEGLIDPRAVFSKSVRRAVPQVKPRSVVLEREQLPLWFQAVRSLSNKQQSVYLQMTLLTGARDKSVAELRWSDVDFRWKKITMHHKKKGSYTIPMPPYLATLLAGLEQKNEFVFTSSRSTSGHLEDVTHRHSVITKEAGIPDLNIHDLRRSFITFSQWVFCPLEITKEISGHARTGTISKHYLQPPMELVREWHTKIETWILEQAGIKQPSDAAMSGSPSLLIVNNDQLASQI